MKIGIVTIYEPITNMGSYLQAYALKTYLEESGHEVLMIQNKGTWATFKKGVMKLNPKREILLRVQKGVKFLQDVSKLKLLWKDDLLSENLDCIIYGSDEIWNLENKYFAEELFWGIGISEQIRKVAYAISVGPMTEEAFLSSGKYADSVKTFDGLLPRDVNTQAILNKLCEEKYPIVCDPTLLVPVGKLSKPIKVPSRKYLLVYTYGLNPCMIEVVKQYAKKHNLLIVSPCFWHLWADKVIECSALQLSTLIAHAECVFTTTFHGAIFTMLNHKKCCIMPVREKVRDVVTRLGESEHLIEEGITLDIFEKKMQKDYDTEAFEERLLSFRNYSENLLNQALK